MKTEAAYYRTEAQRCRELAAKSPSSAKERRLDKIAAECETLADALDNVPPTPCAQSAATDR
jgi:hypothetical protein